MLLERSGIGQPEVLRRIGVTPVVESPHVGEHAVEQRFFMYQWRIREQLGYNQKLSTQFSQLVAAAAWLTTRGGIISTGGYDLAAFAKSDEQLEVPDLFLMFTPHMLDLTATSLAVAPEPGFSGSGYLVSPTTESSIHATSQDPFAAPVIDAQHPLADLVIEEQVPGPDINTPEEAIAHSWVSGHALNATGTVRMGTNDNAPLDADLRVRGVEGLRVADASVLPRQPGNTMAPTIGVGARAARIIADQE